MKYEYKTIRERAHKIQEILNEHGSEGWKVISVSVDFGAVTDCWYVLMERPAEKIGSSLVLDKVMEYMEPKTN